MSQLGFSAMCGQYINQYILAERAQNVSEMQRIQHTLAAQGITCSNIPALPAATSFMPPPPPSLLAGIPQHFLIGGGILLVLVVVVLALKK